MAMMYVTNVMSIIVDVDTSFVCLGIAYAMRMQCVGNAKKRKEKKRE